MKTILYMAISVDGKTTGENEDVSWVTESDIERMDALMMECGVMVMGRGTYESFGDELPNDKALQVVLTSQPELLKRNIDNVVFTDKKPEEVLSTLEEKGFTQVLIAGGEKLNSSLLKSNLIDEIRLIRKPIILGIGKSLFSGMFNTELQLIEVQQLNNGSLEVRYSVKK